MKGSNHSNELEVTSFYGWVEVENECNGFRRYTLNVSLVRSDNANELKEKMSKIKELVYSSKKDSYEDNHAALKVKMKYVETALRSYSIHRAVTLAIFCWKLARDYFISMVDNKR